MPKSKYPSAIASSLYAQNLTAALTAATTIDRPEIDLMAGGDWFVDAIIKYGVNEREERLRINPLVKEFARLIGDLRFQMVATSGAAQVCKTVLHWQLTAAILTIAQRDFMWVYPQATMIAALVPTGFKPIIAVWEIALGLERKSAPTDSKSQKIHQSALGTGRFVAASNPSASRKQMEGMAAAGAGGVAASTDILFMEEASQVQESLLEPFDRRLLQSRLATIPKRKLGTPGSGGGIERDVERARWSFYPHTTCKNCGETSALSPLGWLLKPNAEGEYFDESGIPNRSQYETFWHHHDPTNPIKTAYFGCPHCAAEIDTNQRINESWFQCLKSGDKLSQVLDNIPHGVPKTPLTAGITLSPLIRDSNRNEAYLIIDKGIKTGNAIDWQQQEIGIPTTVANNGITIEMIRRAVNSFSPPRKIDCTFWGLDQGTKEHWICAIHYRYPVDWRLEPIERYRLAHREFAFIQPCTTDDIPHLIMQCHGGSLDNEPGRDWAAEICDTHPGVFMADQRGGKELGGQTVKMGKVFAGGIDREAMFVDTHQMQNYILDYFAAKEQRVRMPRTVDPDDLNKSAVSRHLTTSPRDPTTGRWSRPKDNNDDMLKAIVFAETAFFCYTLGISTPSYFGMQGNA
jgi:Phage terminase large subunit (GpA)